MKSFPSLSYRSKIIMLALIYCIEIYLLNQLCLINSLYWNSSLKSNIRVSTVICYSPYMWHKLLFFFIKYRSTWSPSFFNLVLALSVLEGLMVSLNTTLDLQITSLIFRISSIQSCFNYHSLYSLDSSFNRTSERSQPFSTVGIYSGILNFYLSSTISLTIQNYICLYIIYCNYVVRIILVILTWPRYVSAD